MATKISALTAASAAAGANEIEINEAGTSKKLTAAQLRTYAQTGTATNDSAAAGSIGEYVESIVLAGSAVSLTTATAANVTSISLTAGDWDVSGNIGFVPAGTPTNIIAVINTTSATLPTAPNAGAEMVLNLSFTAAQAQIIPVGSRRLSLAGTTTIYLIAQAAFSSTCTAYGAIWARRAR